MIRRFLSISLLFVLLLNILLPLFPSASAEFENTYVNTGNQIEDLIGVAMTQLGYTEGPENDTKYGDWLGYPNLPWCASFISWCAYQAEIPTDVLARTALANPSTNPGFSIDCYHGSEYMPKRGDLFFKEDFSHVGIVYGVEGEDVLTIEANTNNDGSAEGYTVLLRTRKIAESYFGVPDYEGVDDAHTYERKNDPGHPHPAYYVCTTCGDFYYTFTPTHVLDCSYCMSCGCTADTEGYYKVTKTDGRLIIYSQENPKKKDEASLRKGYLDPGELVYVVAGDRDWAHIIYAGSVGYVQMAHLQKFVPVPTELTCNNEKFYKNDTATLNWGSVHTATDYIVTVLKDGQTVLNEKTGGATTFQIPALAVGNYEVLVEATDGEVLSEAATCAFYVLDTYAVHFDTAGGDAMPGDMVKLWDENLVLDSTVPTREGYRFFGWNTKEKANYTTYQPGDIWTDNRDVTLFAVWQREDAVPAKLEIQSPASTYITTIGQDPSLTGLVLRLTYSDGTVKQVNEGFSVSSFDSTYSGVYPFTIFYEGLSVTYNVRVLASPVSQCSRTWSYDMTDLFPMS